MRYIKGDAVQLARNNNGILIHQVNCQRVANSGIAKQIRDTFPGWYEHYIRVEPNLGQIDVFNHNGTIIISMYSQDTFGYRKGNRYTDYDAFELCLSKLAPLLNKTPLKGDLYVPNGIGCGLGGGDWKVISVLVESYLPDAIVVSLE